MRVDDVGITYPEGEEEGGEGAERYQPFSIYFKCLFVAEKRRVPRRVCTPSLPPSFPFPSSLGTERYLYTISYHTSLTHCRPQTISHADFDTTILRFKSLCRRFSRVSGCVQSITIRSRSNQSAPPPPPPESSRISFIRQYDKT